MVTVRLATIDDLTRIARTTMRAFADDPVLRWLFPDDDEYFAGDGRTLHFLMRNWLAHGHTYTTDDGVAVAVFVPPGRPEIDAIFDPSDPPMPAGLLERFDIIGPVLAANTPAEPHWYLQLLGTHPDWQRQGLGALLIEQIGEVCDREGLPMYLETETIENVAYYGRLGFQVTAEWDVPAGGPHMWGMRRGPRSRR
jgi:GNAT superfamily N-acetyltransferase